MLLVYRKRCQPKVQHPENSFYFSSLYQRRRGEIVTRIKQHKICFCLRLSEVECTECSTIKSRRHTVFIKSNRKGNDFWYHPFGQKKLAERKMFIFGRKKDLSLENPFFSNSFFFFCALRSTIRQTIRNWRQFFQWALDENQVTFWMTPIYLTR